MKHTILELETAKSERKRRSEMEAARVRRDMARDLGLTTFKGTVCVKYPTHGRQRYVASNVCMECQRLRSKRLASRRPKRFKAPKVNLDDLTYDQEQELRNGADKFYGNPCREGHDGLRYLKSRICVHCHRARDRSENKPALSIRTINRLLAASAPAERTNENEQEMLLRIALLV